MFENADGIDDDLWVDNLCKNAGKDIIIENIKGKTENKKEEEEEVVHSKSTPYKTNLTIDLHGFTASGAIQVVHRTLQMCDPGLDYEITFITGVGNHSSHDPVLRRVVGKIVGEKNILKSGECCEGRLKVLIEKKKKVI